jgi:hypothetical protein
MRDLRKGNEQNKGVSNNNAVCFRNLALRNLTANSYIMLLKEPRNQHVPRPNCPLKMKMTVPVNVQIPHPAPLALAPLALPLERYSACSPSRGSSLPPLCALRGIWRAHHLPSTRLLFLLDIITYLLH